MPDSSPICPDCQDTGRVTVYFTDPESGVMTPQSRIRCSCPKGDDADVKEPTDLYVPEIEGS